ncbi:MAG TPA: histidinol-phosphate transaminase [Solirubrobacteraceae bacterium]
MGLLDYYRQFEGLSEEEVNQALREQAAERKRKALTTVQTLDLSHTTWPELPHPYIVNSITFVARAGLHSYPQKRSSKLQNELAQRHNVDPTRIVIGNGAAQLLSSATRALIEPGQELLTTWPSYPLFPIMARRAHGQAIPVNGGVDELLETASSSHNTRVLALASPNDPTGELLETAELERLLSGLPEQVAVLLDESLVEFSDAQPLDASLALLESHPRLLVFRSFSKAWGLAGLRVGYTLGGPGSEELLAELEPDLGVPDVSQAGCLEALRSCSDLVTRRAQMLARERRRVTDALRERHLEVADSQANFLWVAHPTLDGEQLAGALARAGIRVAAGAALGEPRHVRISLYNQAASDRLLNALEGVAG